MLFEVKKADATPHFFTPSLKYLSYAGTQPSVPMSIFVIKVSEIACAGILRLIDSFADIRIPQYISFSALLSENSF